MYSVQQLRTEALFRFYWSALSLVVDTGNTAAAGVPLPLHGGLNKAVHRYKAVKIAWRDYK